MRLINRSKESPVGRIACDLALKAHLEKFGDYGKQGVVTDYMVRAEGTKIRVEVKNGKESYVATAMTGQRRLKCLPREYGRG